MEEKIKKRKSKVALIIAVIALIAIAVIAVIVVKTGSPEYKLKKQLEIADKYLAELDYEQAIVAYRMALDIDPKNTDAYIGIANALEGQGKLEEAIDVLEEGYTVTQDAEILSMLESLRQKLNMAENDTDPGKGGDGSTDASIPQKTAEEIRKEYEDVFNFAEQHPSFYNIQYLSFEEMEEIFSPIIHRLEDYISEIDALYPEGYPEVKGADPDTTYLFYDTSLYMFFAAIQVEDYYYFAAHGYLYYFQLLTGATEDAAQTRNKIAVILGLPEMTSEGYVVHLNSTYISSSDEEVQVNNEYVLDALGRVIRIENGLGDWNERSYARGGKLERYSYSSGHYDGSVFSHEIIYEYDESGRLISKNDHQIMEGDPAGCHVTIDKYQYDNPGMVTYTTISKRDDKTEWSGVSDGTSIPLDIDSYRYVAP